MKPYLNTTQNNLKSNNIVLTAQTNWKIKTLMWVQPLTALFYSLKTHQTLDIDSKSLSNQKGGDAGTLSA